MTKWTIYPLPLLSLFSITLAVPGDSSGGPGSCGPGCLTDAQTADIVSRWTSIAIKIDVKVVDKTVTNDFQFFSDNQNFLEGTPVSVTEVLGSFCSYADAYSLYKVRICDWHPSINGKQDLINQQTAAQASGTAVIPQSFTIFRSMHNCHDIVFRWRFHAKSSGTDPNSTNEPGDPVEYAGLDWLILASGTNLIKAAYSEWDSGELLQDLGTRTCFQKGNASACAPCA